MDGKPLAAPPTSSVLMNAAFALDEMLQDAHFRRMNADMEALERSAEFPEAPATATLSIDSLAVFLKEMDQLEGKTDGANAKTTAAGPAGKPKKMSSSQRARRDKLALESTIAELQLDIERILKDQRRKLARVHERWQPIIRHELYELKRVETTRRRLHRMIHAQWGKAGRIAHLIHQLRDSPMDYQSVHFGRSVPSEDDRDAAIFAALERNIERKYQLLEHKLRVATVSECSSEALETNVSPDGKSMDVYLARFVPFSVAAISRAAWRWGQREYADSYTNVRLNSLGAMAFKQELIIGHPDQSRIKLTLRAVYKQFSSGIRTVLHWEGTCDWAMQSGTTSTQESGWVIFQPLGSDWPGSSISVVQSLVQITPADSTVPWKECLQKRSALPKVILPSSEQAMAKQHQSVENSLIDSSPRSSLEYPESC